MACVNLQRVPAVATMPEMVYDEFFRSMAEKTRPDAWNIQASAMQCS
jgi:hypothetical protein